MFCINSGDASSQETVLSSQRLLSELVRWFHRMGSLQTGREKIIYLNFQINMCCHLMPIWKKTNLNVQIVNIIKEVFDSILLSNIMKHNKPYMWGKELRKAHFFLNFCYRMSNIDHITMQKSRKSIMAASNDYAIQKGEVEQRGEKDMSCRDKGRHKPLVELVHSF